jgi:hypothetical protein
MNKARPTMSGSLIKHTTYSNITGIKRIRTDITKM